MPRKETLGGEGGKWQLPIHFPHHSKKDGGVGRWEGVDDGQHEGSVSVLAEVASTLAAYSFQHNEVDVWLSSPECRRFPALGKMSEMKEGKGLLNWLLQYQSQQELDSLAGITGII